ncbi:MAG: plasmid pRiA4b ORF-3 family protein [Streptosporangiaceae bacterium]
MDQDPGGQPERAGDKDIQGDQVYRLRVVLAGISPLIWRQLDVAASTTLAGLHRILQIAFGWSGEHLHRFTVRGVDYRAYEGQRPLDGKDAGRVTLAGLGLRISERLTYDYAFFSNLCTWRHDLRVQAIEPARPNRSYPWCSGGARSAPPEDCGGPQAFLALRQQHSPWAATVRMAELMRPLLDAPPGETVRSALGQDALDELPELLYWARTGTFAKAAVNAALAALCRKDTP